MSLDDISLITRNEYEDAGHNVIAARIRGIRDPDLITAILDVEVNNRKRQDVIAALNQRKRILQENPALTRPISELPKRDLDEIPEKPEPVFLDRDGNIRENRSTAHDKARSGLLAPDGGTEE